MNFFGQKTQNNQGKPTRVKAGFTLIELMVYIALLGGIVLIAGKAFNNSTKMRIRTQSMLQANQTVGNAATAFKSDLSLLGAKSSKEAADADDLLDVFDTTHIKDVYMDPENNDSSSYAVSQDFGGAGLDKITIRRLRYSNTGAFDGVEEVAWFVEGRILKRSCKSIISLNENTNCPKDDSVVVEITDNVERFKISEAIPNTVGASATSILPSTSETEKNFKLVPRFGDENFEPLNVDPQNGGETVRLAGFAANYDFSTNEPITSPDLIKANQVFLALPKSDETSWNVQCEAVSLAPFVEYEISFAMPFTNEDPTRLFCPGRDHMAVGFRYIDNGQRPAEINDFQFYPPTVQDPKDEGLRKMRFVTSDSVKNVCLAFTFALFSPVAYSGNINITDVRLRKIPSSTYQFFNDSTPSIADKKNVKALKMELVVSKNGENGVEKAIIPIPSNGPRD